MPTTAARNSTTRMIPALPMMLAAVLCVMSAGEAAAQDGGAGTLKALKIRSPQKDSRRKHPRTAVNERSAAAERMLEQERLPVPFPVAAERLQANPPRPLSICYEELDRPTGRHNSILYVRFDSNNRRLGSTISLNPEGSVIVLRDDGKELDDRAGDGTYTALADLDLEDLDEWRNIVNEAANGGAETLRFDGRALVGSKRVLEEEDRDNPDRVRLPPSPGANRPIAPADDVCRSGSVSSLPPVLLPPPPALDAENSLLIRDLSVVEDPTRTYDPCSGVGTPGGKWTFRYVMEQMANQLETGISAAEFTRRWLQQWEFDLSINFHQVPARTNIVQGIIDPWEQASGGPGQPLNLDEAPFKLVAIVNRVDLRENLAYGAGSAGEARLVFGVLNRSGGGCLMMPFAVIFEYGIQKDNCLDLQQWAAEWYDLSNLTLGSPAYNAALESITEQFVTAGANPENLPNKSALNQIRTNEIALDAPWELREFKIQAPGHYDSGHLRSVTVAMTPDLSFNLTSTLTDFINQNETAIVAGTYDVPLSLPSGPPFLGGNAPTPFGMFWDGSPGCGSINNPDARHNFSLTTCNGCHAGETATPFLHIDPQQSPAGLSGFLTGITVSDPCTGLNRDFADLERRRIDIENLVNSPAFPPCLNFMPLRQPH